jgi:ornithine carbamoyltransferase
VIETDDIGHALAGAHVVCAKEWGALDSYGHTEAEARAKAALRERWRVEVEWMQRTDDAVFLHCLPVRRNVVVSDAVLNSSRSAVVDQAENRLWTAAAVFGALAPR